MPTIDKININGTLYDLPGGGGNLTCTQIDSENTSSPNPYSESAPCYFASNIKANSLYKLAIYYIYDTNYAQARLHFPCVFWLRGDSTTTQSYTISNADWANVSQTVASGNVTISAKITGGRLAVWITNPYRLAPSSKRFMTLHEFSI